MSVAIVLVHGGAGAWQRGSAHLETARTICEQAAAAGRDALASGGCSIDAVETAVRLLEDAPMMNAGRGSVPNAMASSRWTP
jgi:beta-aspartyl-peptidase (threonine type)